MVAVDGSDYAKAAFYTATMMAKPTDHVYLISVIEDLRVYGLYAHGLPLTVYDEAQEKAKKEASRLLHRYGRVLDQRKVLALDIE